MNKVGLRKLITRKSDTVALKKIQSKDPYLSFQSKYHDDFEAHLPQVTRFLQKLKINDEDVYRITAIVGEIGNNSFDHNLGRWPK